MENVMSSKPSFIALTNPASARRARPRQFPGRRASAHSNESRVQRPGQGPGKGPVFRRLDQHALESPIGGIEKYAIQQHRLPHAAQPRPSAGSWRQARCAAGRARSRHPRSVHRVRQARAVVFRPRGHTGSFGGPFIPTLSGFSTTINNLVRLLAGSSAPPPHPSRPSQSAVP